MTFPKVKGNYKGIAPMPQMMRKKGVAPPPVPGSAAEKKLNEEKAAEEAKAMEEAEGKKMVQEMAEPGSETGGPRLAIRWSRDALARPR